LTASAVACSFPIPRFLGVCTVVAAALGALLGCSNSFADETVQVCGSYANSVFASSAVPAITASGRCPTVDYNGGGLALIPSGIPARGQAGRWQANAPAGLELVGATASGIISPGVNDTAGDFGGGFYWAGGGIEATDQTDRQPSVGMVFASPSSYFGIQLLCGKSTCPAPAQLAVAAVSLYVRETVGPSFAAPNGLWQSTGWVRGSWPFFAWGNSPSGLCSLSATLNGSLINQTTAQQDVSTWHQCATGPIDQAVDTSKYGQGAIPLTLSASDAAGIPASTTKTVYVDNQQPTVTLSGPTDAASTAGTQYVTAAASAGPSGVAGISCSIDDGPAQWYSSSTAQVPVAGVGQHQVHCFSENNAVDGNGAHGTSASGSFSMKIGVPTVTGIAFSKLVDELRCDRAVERVRIPARWVTVRRHGKRVRVRRGAHTERVKVRRCHVRTARRRVTVWVTVRRGGKNVRVRRHKTIRVLLEPHVVNQTRRVVSHGHATTVDGWLGTASGTALGGQTVEVITAADNGRGNFRVAAIVTTAANGGWSARLPPGPSRLVSALYAGGPTTEGSTSAQVNLIVPAKVELLSASPRRVPWGGTVRLVGQLKGGYLPPGGALVRLRIGLGSAVTTYGIQEHVTGNGRFSTTYTFGDGLASVHHAYWFQLASLPMGNFPWAPSTSRRITVIVGGHPARAAGVVPRPSSQNKG
jgi:hypothetical protein